MSLPNAKLIGNYRIVRSKVDPDRTSRVTLVAVSKKQPSEAIRTLYGEGQRVFGENYVQELQQKAQELLDCSEICWHFIGHLQSNKARFLIPLLSSPESILHSVDSEKLAKEIAKVCRESKRGFPLKVLIEVNIDGENSKTGISAEKARDLAEKIAKMPELSLQGLMCMPNPEGDPRPKFNKLKIIEKELRPLTQGFLSMGMSSDYEVAISEGATHVRVGTSIFGPR